MSFDRLQYELKLGWRTTILAPICTIVVVILFTLLQLSLKQSTDRSWLAAIEIFLPLAAGIVAASITAQDAAIELQLALPRRYAVTSFLRLLLIFVWSTCLALLCLTGMNLFKLFALPEFMQTWSPIIVLLTVQLLWLTPLLWFITLGICLAPLTQSRTASGTLLGGIWLMSLLFVGTIASVTWLRPVLLFPMTLIIYPPTHISWTDFTTYWLITRFELLAMVVIFLLIDWLLLSNSERLLKGATEE